MMRQNEPGVYRGLNASRVELYGTYLLNGGRNARKCMMAAVLFENIYRRSEWNAHRNPEVYEGINASGGVSRQQCSSKIYV